MGFQSDHCLPAFWLLSMARRDNWVVDTFLQDNEMGVEGNAEGCQTPNEEIKVLVLSVALTHCMTIAT